MISKFLRRVMGGEKSSTVTELAAREDYKGTELRAKPIKEGNHWRVAGTIAKVSEGGEKTHDFVRADTFPDQETAASVSLDKARRLVDQMGDQLFE